MIIKNLPPPTAAAEEGYCVAARDGDWAGSGIEISKRLQVGLCGRLSLVPQRYVPLKRRLDWLPHFGWSSQSVHAGETQTRHWSSKTLVGESVHSRGLFLRVFERAFWCQQVGLSRGKTLLENATALGDCGSNERSMAPHSPHFVASHRQGKKLRFSKKPLHLELWCQGCSTLTRSRVFQYGSRGDRAPWQWGAATNPAIEGVSCDPLLGIGEGGNMPKRESALITRRIVTYGICMLGACQSRAAGDIRSLGVLNRFGGLRAGSVSQAAAARQDDVDSRALAPRLAAMEPLRAQGDPRRNTP